MTLDIGRAVSEGVSRLTSRGGLALLGAFVVLGIASTVAQQSLLVATLEALVRAVEAIDPNTAGAPTAAEIAELRTQLQTLRAGSPLALDVSAGVAAAGAFVLALVAEALTLVAIRVFAAESEAFPDDATARLLPATLNGFLGGVVVAVLVTIGLAFFILPGVFLYVVFLFLRQEVALEDRNFVDALAESYELTKGNRFQVFGLVVVLAVIGIAGALPSFVVGVFAPGLVSTAVGLLISPVILLFGVAVTTRAYLDLSAESEAEPEEESIGALGPDDIPEP